ncbi:MAG: hypothetical protein H7Z37_03455 [Pyrinomonadaceae bacterium]|nr:hypothetical protein [Pyrinomonadaceae bacterium]
MALETPPPYFPQGTLTPPNPNRYRNFKIIVGSVIAVLLLLIIGVFFGVYYFVGYLAS